MQEERRKNTLNTGFFFFLKKGRQTFPYKAKNKSAP
jgi:hypothetical protein